MNLVNLLSATRGEIVTLLRQGPLTAGDLAAKLGLTANGIRAHLNALQALGLVEQTERRKGLRKPHYLYALTENARGPGAAYEPVLGAIAETLSSQLSADDLREMFSAAGERLAQPFTGTFEERLKATQEGLSALGASTNQEDHPDGVIIRGARCPLSSVVKTCPEACATVVSLVGKLMDEPTEQACKYEPHPMCGVLVKRKSA
jgi:predicted ArsR family transcriptional regulator